MTKLDCAGLLGAGSQILRLLLRITPQWQTITAFPIGLTEETLISEPIFKALYDVTSLKPLDKVSTALSMHGGNPVGPCGNPPGAGGVISSLSRVALLFRCSAIAYADHCRQDDLGKGWFCSQLEQHPTCM